MQVLAKLHSLAPKGHLRFVQGIKIAHLALKHRQGKNHKTRIVAFVGSPISIEEAALVKLAKQLKKEKVNIDIISFGETVCSTMTSALANGHLYAEKHVSVWLENAPWVSSH